MTMILKNEPDICIELKIKQIRDENLHLMREETVLYLTHVTKKELEEILSNQDYYADRISNIYCLLFVEPSHIALKKYKLTNKGKYALCMKCGCKFKSWGNKRCLPCHRHIDSKISECTFVNI